MASSSLCQAQALDVRTDAGGRASVVRVCGITYKVYTLLLLTSLKSTELPRSSTRGLAQGRASRQRPRWCARAHGQLMLVIATLLLLFTAAAIASTMAKDASSSTWANTQ